MSTKARRINIVWATHPRHLPKPPEGRVAVVDVAFAAGKSIKKTKSFINKLGDRLVSYVDHHEHVLWSEYEEDERFLLVPNRIAHACPELITPEVVFAREGGIPVDNIVAHADFDGLVAAAKWRAAGEELWPEADEDARAVDSPGRGHTLSPYGARYAHALEEASATGSRQDYCAFLSRVADAISYGENDSEFSKTLDDYAARAGDVAQRAKAFALENGREEAPGVFVVRLNKPVENRVRKHYLMAAETQCAIGALYEPDPQGGAWVTAATFRQDIDLAEIEGFEGGRSDYRFARAIGDGSENIARIGQYFESLPKA